MFVIKKRETCLKYLQTYTPRTILVNYNMFYLGIDGMGMRSRDTWKPGLDPARASGSSPSREPPTVSVPH